MMFGDVLALLRAERVAHLDIISSLHFLINFRVRAHKRYIMQVKLCVLICGYMN